MSEPMSVVVNGIVSEIHLGSKQVVLGLDEAVVEGPLLDLLHRNVRFRMRIVPVTPAVPERPLVSGDIVDCPSPPGTYWIVKERKQTPRGESILVLNEEGEQYACSEKGLQRSAHVPEDMVIILEAVLAAHCIK